jgi:hypothetical protein
MVSGTILSVFSQHHPVHFSYTPVSKIPVLNSTLKQRVFWHYFFSIKSVLTSTFFIQPCLIFEIPVLNSTLKQHGFWHYFVSIKSALTNKFFIHPCLLLEIAIHFFFHFRKKNLSTNLWSEASGRWPQRKAWVRLRSWASGGCTPPWRTRPGPGSASAVKRDSGKMSGKVAMSYILDEMHYDIWCDIFISSFVGVIKLFLPCWQRPNKLECLCLN